MNDVRIGIVGCGHAARVHLARLVGIAGVQIVGLADADVEAARRLAATVPDLLQSGEPSTFGDHLDLLKACRPDALAIFTPHLAHYRPTMDGLQAGCHVFIEKPLSTNVQEAVDIVTVARARERKVAVGHQFRLLPSLREARDRISSGQIGSIRLVVATMAQPWLEAHGGQENSWRFDPKVAGGGILADAGDHLLDALLWSLGQVAVEVAAIQGRHESGADLVTASALKLSDGTLATIGLSGNSAANLFELTYLGETGRIRVNENRLVFESSATSVEAEVPPLPAPIESIDGNFIAAIRDGATLCCPADQALDTVRLQEAIARSAATGQVVRLA